MEENKNNIEHHDDVSTPAGQNAPVNNLPKSQPPQYINSPIVGDEYSSGEETNSISEDKKKYIWMTIIILIVVLLAVGLWAIGKSRNSSSLPNQSVSEIAPVAVAPSNTAPGNSEVPAATPNSNQASVDLSKTFQDQVSGYQISYPADWVFEKTVNDVTFSGQDGTNASYCQVDVQNDIESTSLDAMVKELKDEYTTNGDTAIRIYDEKPFTYNMKDGTKLVGSAFKVEYVEEGDNYRDWQIIIPRNGKFFTWMYNAPKEDYDTYYNIALAMLNSWVITK